MRVVKSAVLIVLLLFSSAVAQEFSRASKTPQIMQEGDGKQWCPVCGMSIPMFYKTSMAIEGEDGVKKHYCSIKCQLEEHATHGAKNIFVADAKTEKMIDAKSAFYVIGSKAPATMSTVSKYAFANKSDAKEFQAKYGGELGNYEKAVESSKATRDADTQRTKGNWVNKMFPMGKKIYESKCEKIDVDKYLSINELKDAIVSKKLCKELQGEKELQPLAQYLWQNVTTKDANEHIIVPKYAKCEVCGMFVAKYPKWAVEVKDGDHAHYFDGVKDMMDYLFNDSHVDVKTATIRVSDFNSGKAIDGKNAFYVIGSKVYGPMGEELIPFASQADAMDFKKENKGKNILKFDEITKDTLKQMH